MERILVIVAHPDDEVLGMGGTIAKLSSTGNEVHCLIVTDGSSSQYRDSTDLNRIIEDKKQETNKAAEILGIRSITYGGLPDMRLDVIPHTEINRVIEKVIEELRPTIVYTHFWGDVNRDHQAVYESTLVATRPQFNQCVKELYCFSVPSSTEWMPFKADTMFMPNIFVEIEKYKEMKYSAMDAYKTEVRGYPHPRSKRHLQEMDISVGLQVGLKASESFVCLRRIVK